MAEAPGGPAVDTPASEKKADGPSMEARVTELESVVRSLRQELARVKKEVRSLKGSQPLSIPTMLTQLIDDAFEDEKEKDKGFQYLQAHMNEVVEAKDFLALPLEALKSLYERIHFLATEDTLFRGLLAWTRNQTQTPDEQKKILAQFVPVLRFELMSSQFFSSQVLPYSLLPMEKSIQLITDGLSKEKKGGAVLSMPPITVPHDLTSVTAPSGQILKFSGSGHVRLHSAPPLGENFTIMVRVRPTLVDGAYHGILGKQASSRSPSMWLAPHGGFHWDSYSLSGERHDQLVPGFFRQDEWVHIAWVHQDAEFILYRNATEIKRGKAPTKCLLTAGDYDIGRVDNYFVGELTDLRFYNQALSHDQVGIALGYRPGSIDALISKS